MRGRSLLICAVVVLACAASVPAFSEEPGAGLCPALGRGVSALQGQGSEQPAQPGVDPDLEKYLQGLALGSVQYKDPICTASYDCPGGPTIQCIGSSTCSISTVSCSAQGSTCPDQASTVGAVVCDGAVRASCPCPEVCFGCGSSCTTNANCAAACTCGSGFCRLGHCTCPY